METLDTSLSIPEESLIFETVTYLRGGVVFTPLPTFITSFICGAVRISLWTLITEIIVLILKILGANTLTLIRIQYFPGRTFNGLALL